MFAAYWAAHNRGAGALCNVSSCSNSNRAVDDCELRVETFDVANGLPYEVLDLKGVANMENPHLVNFPGERSYVYSDRAIVPGSELKERFSNFTEPGNHYTTLI
jgi:hypothetical protein